MGLDNGGALRLTTALYYTKSGHSIQAKGIEPDIVIDVTGREVTGDSEAEEKKGRQVRESDLRGAIKNPEDEKSERRKTLELMRRRNPETANLKDLLENDPQLRRALELLKSFDIFKGTGTVQALVTAQK